MTRIGRLTARGLATALVLLLAAGEPAAAATRAKRKRPAKSAPARATDVERLRVRWAELPGLPAGKAFGSFRASVLNMKRVVVPSLGVPAEDVRWGERTADFAYLMGDERDTIVAVSTVSLIVPPLPAFDPFVIGEALERAGWVPMRQYAAEGLEGISIALASREAICEISAGRDFAGAADTIRIDLRCVPRPLAPSER